MFGSMHNPKPVDLRARDVRDGDGCHRGARASECGEEREARVRVRK